MKILFVTPYFYPKAGGLEHYSFKIARGLVERGHQSVVVTSNHVGNKRGQETIDGVRVYRLPRLLKLSNTPVHPGWARTIRDVIQLEQPDVINAHTPVPFIADVTERVRGKTPFVLTYHNDLVKPAGIAKQLAKATYKLGMQKTINRANAVIVTSKHYAHTSPYLKKRQGPIAIVPPGVDTARLNARVDKTWLKQQYGKRFTVLFVGQMDISHDHKGLGILMQACAQLQKRGYDLQLVAVGGGDGLTHYKALAKRVGLAHYFSPGYVADADMPKYFAGADVHVLPSVTTAEGFGMVLIEASSCGTAVIGSNIGGIGQAIVENHTGLLVEPGNVQALADAIAKLHNDPTLRQTLGHNGALRAQKDFDWQNQALKTEQALLSVIDRQNV